MRAAQRQIWLGHLPSGPIGADCPDPDAEVVGDVRRRPPLGGWIGSGSHGPIVSALPPSAQTTKLCCRPGPESTKRTAIGGREPTPGRRRRQPIRHGFRPGRSQAEPEVGRAFGVAGQLGGGEGVEGLDGPEGLFHGRGCGEDGLGLVVGADLIQT
jgi:hypothetical protein